MGAATKLKAVCCYVVCCGCFKICCKKSAPRPPGEKKESRLKRFRKFLNFGNFKLGILRRALWRKQAEERMNKLVEEEMLKMGKIAALAPVKEKPRGLRLLRFSLLRQKNKMARVSMQDVASVVGQEAKRPSLDGEESVSSLGSLPEGVAPAGPPGSVPPPHLRFRSHYQPRQAEKPFVHVRCGSVLGIKGAALCSSRGCDYDCVQRAWRFLTPGVSALRVEFGLSKRSGVLELRLVEFYSPLAARGAEGSCVDVLLNGHLVVPKHHPERGEPTTFVAVLEPDDFVDDGDQVVEIALREESDAWNYLLESFCVAAPRRKQDAPTRDESKQIIHDFWNAPSAAPDYATEVQKMRVKLAKADIQAKSSRDLLADSGDEPKKQFKSAGPGRETIAAKQAEATIAADAKRRKAEKKARDEAHAGLDDEYRAEFKRADKTRRKIEKYRRLQKETAKHGSEEAARLANKSYF